MDIRFGDYRITTDSRQYILWSGGRRRYYTRLKSLAQAVVDDGVKKSDASTLEELVVAVREGVERTQKAIEGV